MEEKSLETYGIIQLATTARRKSAKLPNKGQGFKEY